MVECQSECGIQNTAVNVDTEIDFQHIPLLENCVNKSVSNLVSIKCMRTSCTCGISSIGCVVSCAMVQTHSGGETDTAFETFRFHQCPSTIFNVVNYVSRGHSWANIFPGALSHLAMYFCGTSDVIVCSFRVFVH